MSSRQLPVPVDSLLDAFIALYYDCKNLSNPPQNVSNFMLKYKAAVTRLELHRKSKSDLVVLKTLATGSVGRVSLVQSKQDGQFYAMKILKKRELLSRREAAFFMEEKESMILGRDSEWLTRLHMSFQDESAVYLVMEYLAGGSLKGFIESLEQPMDEPGVRFYVAEMILSIDEVHRLGFIHRDIKPDNFLIDSHGHLKLADFGSCIRIEHAQTTTRHETVGTPDYISPEILRAHEGSTVLNETCDWWSLGICIYELLYDEVPFYAETLVQTYARIMEHEKFLEFPDFREVSSEVTDLIKKLVCNQEHRLGTKSVTEIQQHAWFSPISWDNMRSQPPPFVPELDGPDDTKYFENEEIEAETAEKKVERTRDFSGQHLPFIGYSFSGEMQETVTEEPDFVVLKELHSLKTDLTSERNQASKLQTAIVKLEEQKAALEADNRRLALSSQMTLHDKDSLEVQLEEALAKAKKPEVDVRLEDLGSANLALEIELTRIQNNYENSKKRLESVQSDLVDSLQKLADKDSEIASLKKSLEDHEDLVRKLSALQDKLDAEIEKSVEKNTEISRLQASTVELEGKVATLETSISEQSQHEINLKENLQKLEKEKASLSLEIGHLKLQMKSISQENQRLSDDATRFTDKHIQEANEVVRKANDELVERIHALERSQAEKEVEMEALKLQLQNEIAAHATVRALLTHTESKVRNSNQSLLDAKIRADHLDSQLQVANKRSATLRDCLKVENEIVKSLEQKVTSLQTTLTKTQSRLENEAAKALVASEESKSLLAQVAQLEASFSKERSIVTEKERDLIVMTAQAETLQKEKITLIEKMGIVMKQYEAFMEEAQNSIAASKKDYTELEMKYTVECEKKASVDKIKATMSGLVADLETAAKKETDERLRLEHLLEESNHKIELLESQASLSRPRDSYTPQPAQPRTSDSSDRFSFQLLKTPRKTHRLSFKGLFRSSGALNETPKRSINSRIDLDEESYSTHERSASLDTCNRSQISLLDVHDDILKGTLKIPKGGKLRKGWIEKFFIVKDFRLLMFDRERDIEHMEGILVADFAGSIFLAKAVAPNEVIHVNARDVNSVLKIQSSSSHLLTDDQAQTSAQIPEKTAFAARKKLAKIRAELDMELKMQQATEKIMHVSNESQKAAILGQLESSDKRIQHLNFEVETYMKAIESLPEGTENEIRQLDSTTKETIANLKKELERQIEVEYHKKDAIHRMEAGQQSRKSSKALAGYADDLETIDRAVNKLKETIGTLESGDQEAIVRILDKYEYSMTHLGHQFKMKQFYNIMDCAVCHEALWGGKRQGLECSECKEICHKTCMSLIDIPCKEVLHLRSVPTMYFMAKDPHDRSRWLHGLNHFRRELDSQRESSSPRKAMMSPIDRHGGSLIHNELRGTASTLTEL